jgi:hypothetical protein
MRYLLVILCLVAAGCARHMAPAPPPAPPSLYTSQGNIVVRAVVTAHLGHDVASGVDWYEATPTYVYANYSSADVGGPLRIARPSHQEPMPLAELTLVIQYEDGVYSLIGWLGPVGDQPD